MEYFCILLGLELLAIISAFDGLELRFPFHYNLAQAPSLYDEFIKKYGRDFRTNKEKNLRYNAFLKTLKTVNNNNAQSGSQKLKVNKYADYTDEERVKLGQSKRGNVDMFVTRPKRLRVIDMFKLIDDNDEDKMY